MYLALRPPWDTRAVPPPQIAMDVSAVDAGAGKPKPKRKRPRGAAVAGERGWGDSGAVQDTAPQQVRLSAADRAVEWRGDDTSRPPQKIDMSDGTAARSLDDGEIRSTFDAQSGPVQSCVVAGATNTDLSGTITLKLVIDGTGRVSKTKVAAFHYMFEHGLLACIRRAVAQLQFPATGASTLVTLPIELS